MGVTGCFVIERIEDSIRSGLAFDFRCVPRQRSWLALYQRGLLLQKRLDFLFFSWFSFQLNEQCELSHFDFLSLTLRLTTLNRTQLHLPLSAPTIFTAWQHGSSDFYLPTCGERKGDLSALSKYTAA